MNWAEPEIDFDPAYIEAASNYLQFNLGWFAKPILIDGQYPEVMREKVFMPEECFLQCIYWPLLFIASFFRLT